MAGQGKLEQAVLRTLWEHPDGMAAREVAEALPGRERAITTVLTVLDRLRGKDLVVRDEGTRPHVYRASVSREDYTAAAMLTALSQASDRDAALTRFLGGVTDTDVAHLRRALRHRRK